MKRGFEIRLAGAPDLDALCALENAAFSADRFTRDQIEYLLTRSRATTFVVTHKDQVVGSACLLWRKSHKSARLYNIAIHPTYQGQKLGAALLRECELEAARRSCEQITLEVRPDNATAIRVYEKKGFKPGHSVANYYEDGSPALKMSKPLNVTAPAELRLEAPYFAQTLDFTCGPACLMMALKHFRPETELTRAFELNLWKEATLIYMTSGYGGTDGYGLALAALTRGLSCQMIMSLDSTPLLRSVRSAEKREVIRIVHNDMKRRALRAGLSTAVYQYDIDEIIASLCRGLLPIALISTYRLTGDQVPHWVVITGFDKKHIY
ncbi:MAG TPA: ribosomal protein S18-alanine N-acetyltransferase, partial [candidate division Zixibacteria bacterium]|nr:ribosomal protein S18-alanine N-acetyltransferase [candidate division Zixibacteria bacterium]